MRKWIKTRRSVFGALALAGPGLVAGTGSACAAPASINAPDVQVQLGEPGSENATALQFFLLLTVLSLVPAILVMG